MLDVAEVHSFYGEAHILRGATLSAAPGRVAALLGRNGMGKTTLIRSIMALAPARVRAGRISFAGESLAGLRPHEIAARGLGLVPQGRRLFASLSVAEHLAIARKRAGRWTADRVYQLFPRLAERRQHRGNQLSGGERQMLAIGRALMTDPSLLLMDEPSEGLAPVVVQLLEAQLRALKEAGMGILLVEQNLSLALALADEIHVMEGGAIVHRGAADALRADPAPLRRFLGI